MLELEKEHDACGIFASVDKSGVPTRKPLTMGLEALQALKHRAGYVAGEGDGCGLLLDIPRKLWQNVCAAAGLDPELALHPHFFVGHFLWPGSESEGKLDRVQTILTEQGCKVLLVRRDVVDKAALGPLASRELPEFVQVIGLTEDLGESALFRASSVLERQYGVHVMSLSHTTVVYKVVGDGHTLQGYYNDLRHPDFATTFGLAHTRYSTNTSTTFSRVQPFSALGHNGEINTITRFLAEAGMIGAKIDPQFSDSQMVNEMVEFLVAEWQWSLFETAELLFPPIIHEIKHMSAELADMYMFFRALWGPFAQGPAAVMMRAGDEAVFSVDALGLRPLWMLETRDAYCFSSEQGIVPAAQWIAEPKPLAPGEKVGVKLCAPKARVYFYPELQRQVLQRAGTRYPFRGEGRTIHFAGPYQTGDVRHPYRDNKSALIRAVAFGWRDDDMRLLEHELQTGTEPIHSLGYDGPIAALDPGLRLVSDFLQETVAVVTNPAIDREREIEHFSTRVLLGKRPSFSGSYHDAARIEVQAPLLLEQLPDRFGIETGDVQALAHRHGTLCYEDALAALHTHPYGTVEILLHREVGETLPKVLERLRQAAVEVVQAGAHVIVLDDRLTFVRGLHLDPFLAVATVHQALLRAPTKANSAEFLRRRTSIVLRSGSLRNLHDVMVAVGLGADAVNPYLMWEIAVERGQIPGLENLYTALCKGVEKVMSTIGIYEVRGYERLFSGIGLSAEMADLLTVSNFFGTQTAGYSLADMEREAETRQQLYASADDKEVSKQRVFQLYSRIWKAAGGVALGVDSFAAYESRLAAFEKDHPVNLKHLLGIRGLTDAVTDAVDAVDTSIDGHAYPLVISSMSFGSQSETAFRAYAEAAYRLNIVALNGEGGEIKDLLARYPRNRGRQIASGRFGVNAELCNGAYVLEIKIGQGAKPGEGGHLPGSKVTVQVANARNASPGIDLISPSNNHDIYSIEDLAQVIHELRAVNPEAKISVKVPVVPNIGTIAVGIVKAGADIVTLSGFDGGTGAARAHALRRVGLPAEIGIKRVHDALCRAGLRDKAEIWADGGMKSAIDVMKAVLLGANRVGFGTMAMVAVGCTACRSCHKDTCHVGIATQMSSVEEAVEKGVRGFEPREFETAVGQLVHFFRSLGEQLATLTRLLGATRTQDLVGRSDLLVQMSGHDRVDLTGLTQITAAYTGLGTRISYRTWKLEESETDVVAQAVGSEAVSVSYEAVVYTAGVTRGRAEGPWVRPVRRVVGTRESGSVVRQGKRSHGRILTVHPAVAGNGFAAYHSTNMYSVAQGGAQDGVAKTAFGGRIVILKTRGADGVWRGGSVGKCAAYGAQQGLIIIQGDADARAGIRLSGADLVIAGEVRHTLQDEEPFIGARSNLKGFAFEYMTNGRALVLGDPGPWICSGMTGGAVYLRYNPSVGLTEQALRRRIAKGAKVTLTHLDTQGVADVLELLQNYHKELRRSGQDGAAREVLELMAKPAENFRVIRPGKDLTDQSIATE
ncbi:glutamate synthase [Alicyclobacillaceae bacterium I2511]|nr:glutamate synthase [Alicyclobacillaceae bacterium I2511]